MDFLSKCQVTLKAIFYGVPFVIIQWVKVNSLCQMLIFIHVASENVCAMSKSIYNTGSFICIMLNFIDTMYKLICDMQYLICCISFICKMSWSIYDVSMLLCSMSESIYVVSGNQFACFKLFITWAKMAHSVSIFVSSSLLCCFAKSMHSCSKFICCTSRLTFLPSLIITIELFLDMTSASDPTFKNYPTWIKQSWNWVAQMTLVYFA